jgi:hypothetical protein
LNKNLTQILTIAAGALVLGMQGVNLGELGHVSAKGDERLELLQQLVHISEDTKASVQNQTKILESLETSQINQNSILENGSKILGNDEKALDNQTEILQTLKAAIEERRELLKKSDDHTQ